MKKLISFFATFAVVGTLTAGVIDDHCPTVVAYGAPTAASVDQELCRVGYAVGYSYHYRDPVFSSVKITNQSVTGTVKRRDAFREDTEIPQQFRATLADYKSGHWDRGHMTAAGDLTWSEAAMRDSFLLSNMVPQNSSLNRGPWRKLEIEIREWAKQFGTLYVYTGPIFYNNYGTLGRGVAIPHEIFKLVYDPKRNMSISFIVPNADVNSNNLSEYIVLIDNIEQVTGIDFFPGMPYNKKAAHVQATTIATWTRR